MDSTAYDPIAIMNKKNFTLWAIPTLLVVSALAIVTADRLSPSKPPVNAALTAINPDTPPALKEGSHDHSEDDHQDPENNRRMGIFHYNEGNKMLAAGNLQEAVRNYKMALHHNKDFKQAYVNLSTTYLAAKQWDETRDTLTTLETIDPQNPSLFYNWACYFSLTEKTADSLAALQKAVEKGYENFEQIGKDPDLANLRKTPAYKDWAHELKAL